MTWKLIVCALVAQLQPAPVPPGHEQMDPSAEPPSSEDVLRQLDASPDLAKREKTFEIASAIGKLYAVHGRYPEAVQYLTEAVNKGKAVRDVYRRNRKVASATAPKECEVSTDADFERISAEAMGREKKNQRAEAGACAKAALQLVLASESFLGNALFLKGDARGARAEYDRILDVDPDAAGALYARGALAFDQGDSKRAIADLSAFVAKHGDSARASNARLLLARAEGKPAPDAAAPAHGWSSSPALPGPAQAPPPLAPETVRAFESAERTPELKAHLLSTVDEAERALAQGRFQDALERYKQVMPYEPSNGRFRAGMAWALVGLNRQPMADRIWTVAVESDPSAIEALGDALAKKGDPKGAQAVYAKLTETAPAYARSSATLAQKRH